MLRSTISLITSIIAHIAIFVLFRTFNQPEPPKIKHNPVRITFKKKEKTQVLKPKMVPIQKEAPVSFTKKIHVPIKKRKRKIPLLPQKTNRAVTQKQKSSHPDKQRPISTRPQPSTLKGLTFNDLLPTKFDNINTENEKIASNEHQSNNSTKGIYQATTNLYHLANAIANEISIPEEAALEMKNGITSTKFIRKKDEWSVRKIKGPRFLRAILYNTLNSLKENSSIFSYLKTINLNVISLSIEYRTPSGLNYSGDSNKINVFENHIRIILTRQFKSKYLSIAHSSQESKGGVDLLKTFSLLKNLISPERNLILEKIMKSPAFYRPKAILNFLRLE